MFNETRVGTATVVEFIRPDGSVEPMNVDFQYRSDDPHAVTLRFQARDQESTWLVGRELLADGLLSPTGLGDVRLRPGDGDVLVLELLTEDSHAVFHLSAAELQRFLDSTYAAVPAGREAIDFDLLMKDLLG
ncbi:Streptomyces sporulation and cell division protein, SsgA [Lentzea albidocapillata subsp. violacea]|uniref:Streptomyces sporulation and cell division protein, SsgA n=1 Tax=Lentzea albidocapillata subsp. violacea TaxID=128104 RepID=A0A1G8V8G6_9PSEU|nr:SsgA family sporulation/cell division regulator [Lentzea albidocapillata]SDJ62382.1 Streptomyces sporulation and cell division protein, SsgA [Lentzea albidocapillata subsp. violacea]